jgi:hypothetical protein
MLLPFCKSEWNSFTGGRITALGSGHRIAKRIHSNRRSTPEGYAVWEIHPVMKMEAMQ